MKAKVLVVYDEKGILDLFRYHLDWVAGLELGAGDCAVKPFSPRELGERQDQWASQGEKAAKPVFSRAKSVLRKARVLASTVETQISTSSLDQGLATNILEVARTSRCGTIVVGRGPFGASGNISPIMCMWRTNSYEEPRD